MGDEKDTWASSETVTVKNNKFQSHFAELKSKDEIQQKLQQLLESNKKISRASHKHIFAYSIPQTQTFGFNDNGEAGAGEKLLKVLQQHKPDCGGLLAVTRWNPKGTKLRQPKVPDHSAVRAACAAVDGCFGLGMWVL